MRDEGWREVAVRGRQVQRMSMDLVVQDLRGSIALVSSQVVSGDVGPTQS